CGNHFIPRACWLRENRRMIHFQVEPGRPALVPPAIWLTAVRQIGSRPLLLASLLVSGCLTLPAQFGTPPAPDVLLEGRFRTSLKYETALQRLDKYYDEQVGRKGA